MATILLTIVSKNNIPNLLFIKQMGKDVQKHVFITTPGVADKEEKWLAETAGTDIMEKHKSVKFLDEDDYIANVKALKAGLDMTSESDEYIVNLTGGTKAMALAVHRVLSECNSRFYTVSQNGACIYDYQSGIKRKITERISLDEYLALYDISIERKGAPTKEEDANNMFKQLAAKGFAKDECQNIKEASKHDNKVMRSYLSGNWFENYCYFRIKRDYKIADDAIAQGAKIVKSAQSLKADGNEIIANDNEIDVLFVKDNALYTVECKVGVKPDEIVDDEYKAAAIAKYLGFKVKSYIFWLQDLKGCDEKIINIKKRASILGMSGIVTGYDLEKEGAAYL